MNRFFSERGHWRMTIILRREQTMSGTYFIFELSPLSPLFLSLPSSQSSFSVMLLAVMWTVNEKYKIVGGHYYKSLVKGGWTVQSHEIICAALQVILLAGEWVTAAQWVIASQDNCALIWISMNRQESYYLDCSSGKKWKKLWNGSLRENNIILNFDMVQ